MEALCEFVRESDGGVRREGDVEQLQTPACGGWSVEAGGRCRLMEVGVCVCEGVIEALCESVREGDVV